MNAFHWMWRELTRPRGKQRQQRRSRSGVALLLTITVVLFISILTTELAYEASVRMQLGRHQRDEAKAEALANSGVQFYRLILTASKGLGKNPMVQQLEEQFGLDLGDSLWQMIPYIDSGLMRLLFVSGGSVSDSEAEDFQKSGLSEEQTAESREEQGMKRNFLDFDGEFSAEVSDEDKRINVTGIKANNRTELVVDPTAVALYGLMSGTRRCPDPFALDDAAAEADAEREDLDRFFLDRNLDRWQLIGNLADWTDLDNQRTFDGGSEDALYNNLDRDPYLPKNSAFDSFEEIRLVEGWHRDDVWERFNPQITVFGKGKINVNTAECDVMAALLKTYVKPEPNPDKLYLLMKAVEEQKALAPFSSAQQFTSFLGQQGVEVDTALRSAVSTESTVFRVVSTGTVNGATVTIEAVYDFSSSKVGRIRHWRVR